MSTGRLMCAARAWETLPRRALPIHAKADKSDEVEAALADIITPTRAVDGVIHFDVARDLLDPDWFIPTAVYEDSAAIEHQESAPEVHRAIAMFADSLAAPPERTFFDDSVDPVLV